MSLPQLGTVHDDGYGPGTVRGYGFVQHFDGHTEPMALVELLVGFWGPPHEETGNKMWIQMICVHPDNIKEIEE